MTVHFDSRNAAANSWATALELNALSPQFALPRKWARAERPCQQTVFTPNPAGDEERVDEMPEEVDQQSDDRQREKELHHGDAGAPEQSEKAIAQVGIWTSRASRALTQR